MVVAMIRRKLRMIYGVSFILVLSIGINYAGTIQIPVGSVTISLSGLAVAALVGIIINAILPGKDYEFGKELHCLSTTVSPLSFCFVFTAVTAKDILPLFLVILFLICQSK